MATVVVLGAVSAHASTTAGLATWTPAAIAAGKDRRVTSFDDLLTLADRGLITAPTAVPSVVRTS